jgi:hypothetical protein
VIDQKNTGPELKPGVPPSSFAGWLQDIQVSFRMLRRNPGFAFACVTALALAITTHTAVFTVINTVLLKPIRAE